MSGIKQGANFRLSFLWVLVVSVRYKGFWSAAVPGLHGKCAIKRIHGKYYGIVFCALLIGVSLATESVSLPQILGWL